VLVTRRIRASFFVVVAIATMWACAEAGGEVKGGDLTALGSNATKEGQFTAPLPVIPNVGSGATWTDLYRDVFGPTGTPSCVSQGSCHGSGGFGSNVSSGPDCYDSREAGADEAACEVEFVAKWAPIAIALRRQNGATIKGTMPQQPVGVFSAPTLDRIRTWAASKNLDTTGL
jgi:hypothetical protein